MSEQKPASSLEQEVARQIAEGVLPSTVERRLLREGHPEAEVKRLVEAERQRIEDRRAKAQAQAMVNTAKGFALLLVVLGTFLPWSIVTQPDLGLGTGAMSTASAGLSADYLLYGLGFLALCLLLLVLILLTRTHYDPANPRDRAVFGLTTFFEALLAAWWVITFLQVKRSLAGALEMMGPLAEFGGSASFGAGFFAIPVGAVILLVIGYLEIVAVGGARRIRISDE